MQFGEAFLIGAIETFQSGPIRGKVHPRLIRAQFSVLPIEARKRFSASRKLTQRIVSLTRFSVLGESLAIQLGDTFYWKDGGHLWVVISDPSAHQGEFVIVNLTGDLFRAGRECVLQVGDHQWVTKETYVYYGLAKKMGSKKRQIWRNR